MGIWDNPGRIPPSLPPMSLLPYALSRTALFSLDAETAHELTIDTLARLQNTPAQCLWAQKRVDDPVTVAGLRFPNRIGLAAGLDDDQIASALTYIRNSWGHGAAPITPAQVAAVRSETQQLNRPWTPAALMEIR